MTIEDLRALPAFHAAWPSVRDALMEFLHRRQLAMAAADTRESGQQTLSKLILELERLDSAPRPIVRPKALKPLHSMQSEKPTT